MTVYIYFPEDIKRDTTRRGRLVGYRIRNAYVVVLVFYGDIKSLLESLLREVDPSLEVIGHTTGKEAEEFRMNEQDGTVSPEKVDILVNGRASGSAGLLQLSFYKGLPIVVDQLGCRYTVVLFSPPNLRNLEYFTVNPILLNSTGKKRDTTLIDNLGVFLPEHSSDVSDAVLDKVNRCQKTRALVERSNKPASRPAVRILHLMHEALRSSVAHVSHGVVLFFLHILVRLIAVLNSTIVNVRPVHVSAFCRQLDLRLRQITYFPIQFLCYSDPALLSPELLGKLQLPVPNERNNINNSHYINMYNSLWLIANDVLLGWTIHNVILANALQISGYLNDTIVETLMFARLEKMISWIGSDHPAGFKLNNELGNFMEAMLLWSLRAWHDIYDIAVHIYSNEAWIRKVAESFFAASCFCGFSFLVAIVIDTVKLVSLQIYFFNIATTKIYNRQVEMLRSLTQLFQGKKYNVLRNRIDSLDEDQFRVDQLLLGTFIFMVLIYLLPTTFAFYFLFFTVRVSILTVVKLGDKAILCFNMYPLFVLLLKLKNSRRLQGGLYFIPEGSSGNTSWLRMENRALSVDEILVNFVFVFRQEGRVQRFALNFAEGRELAVRDTSALKLQYLMLPGNYSRLVEVWQSIKHL